MLSHVIQRELTWFYPWLRRMAHVLMAIESKSHTLQPTALANEVLAKLLAWRGSVTDNAENALRMLSITIAKQTLIDHGRRRRTRTNHWEGICDQYRTRPENPKTFSAEIRLKAVIDAVEELDSIEPVLGDLVRLRFFEGHSQRRAAEILQLSPRTAARRWAFVKAFLADAIARAEEDNDQPSD
jgi:DNA-directed RNA polymerase specialized sigma24 family protein